MHELGIMTNVMEAVEKRAAQTGVKSILRVKVCVGEMTEAIPDSLEFAWDVLRQTNPVIEHAELELFMIAPESECQECKKVFNHDRFHMKCPYCESRHTTLLHGRDLYIESMEADMSQ